MPVGLWDVEAPTFSAESTHGWQWNCQPNTPAALYPQEDSWYSFLLVTPWLESASKLYRQSDRRFSAKLVPTLADRGCHMVSATNPHCRWFRFSRLEPLLSFQVAPQLSSRGWVNPVPDPLPLRKSGSAGNLIRDLRIYSQEFWPLDHRGGLLLVTEFNFFLKERDITYCTGIYCSSCTVGTVYLV
jgi:hypothetical protein